MRVRHCTESIQVSDATDSDPTAHVCTARAASMPASTPASTLDAEQVRGGTAEQRHAQPAPAAETAQEQPETDALRTEHGSSSGDARAAEDSGGNTGAAAQPSDDSEEEEQEVGWKRLLRIRSSSAPPLSKQPRYVAAGPSAHVRLGGDVDGEEAALHREGGGAPVDASRDRTQPASHSDAPQQSAHHTCAGAHVARTESMAAGGSSSMHEYDGSGVIQLTGDREPPNLREQQPGELAVIRGPSSKEKKRERQKQRLLQQRKQRKIELEAQQGRAATALQQLDNDLQNET